MYLWLIGGLGLLLALYLLGAHVRRGEPRCAGARPAVDRHRRGGLLALFVLVRGLPAAAALLGTVAAFAWRSGSLLRLLSLAGSLFGVARAARGRRRAARRRRTGRRVGLRPRRWKPHGSP